jgi:hypothetical protein
MRFIAVGASTCREIERFMRGEWTGRSARVLSDSADDLNRPAIAVDKLMDPTECVSGRGLTASSDRYVLATRLEYRINHWNSEDLLAIPRQ